MQRVLASRAGGEGVGIGRLQGGGEVVGVGGRGVGCDGGAGEGVLGGGRNIIRSPISRLCSDGVEVLLESLGAKGTVGVRFCGAGGAVMLRVE